MIHVSDAAEIRATEDTGRGMPTVGTPCTVQPCDAQPQHEQGTQNVTTCCLLSFLAL